MGMLVLDVIHSKTGNPFGKVEIHEIGDLTASSPIDRFVSILYSLYPIFTTAAV